MGITYILFWFLTVLTVFSALMVVVSKNPVYSVLWLIFTFFCISGHYIMLNAQFLFIVNIIVYAGAIMVLVVFVIMLLNLDEDKPLNRLRYLFALGGGLGVILLAQTFFIFYAVMRAPNLPADWSRLYSMNM